MSFHRNVTTSRVLFVSFENGAEKKNAKRLCLVLQHERRRDAGS